MKSQRIFVSLAVIGVVTAAEPVSMKGQQVSDTAFVGPSFTPAFAIGGGPLVAIDQAHSNFHTATGRYEPFARFLRRDGFVVDSFTTSFSDASLRRVGVLVIANALARENARRWIEPIRPAFTRSEVIAVRDWVRGGGALLLIADHMPFAGAVHDLAREFGVDVIDGFALREPGNGGILTFRRADNSLRATPVTDGRSAAERIDSVTTFTGNAFRPVDQSVAPLLVFGPGVEVLVTDSAWVFNDRTRHQSAEGLLQGAVVQFGKGRVVITGEAALFSAQVTGPARRPMGMNAPGAEQNPQFLLNIMRWLSRVY